jgi:hypothetical protein
VRRHDSVAPMPADGPTPEDSRLLDGLKAAVAAAPRPVAEIEVGIPLSIALGRLRPAASCGGCAVPLSFEGIPARTNAGLQEPFRLHLRPEGS